ncbi:MAG: aldo/keto reductase [Thermoleophilia bacterium]|nr:aldo/keto reductase [Thermoleophilia bacterium]
MRYRRFGGLDWEVSALGFGVRAGMLPQPDLTSLVRDAIDGGVNYIDLGYPYDMARQRPVAEAVGRALREGYREKVRVAVTVPVAAAASRSSTGSAALGAGAATAGSAAAFDHSLGAQLDWLQIDHADFCVLGGIDRLSWPLIVQSGLLRQADQAVSDGRVGSLGFAFRDHYHVLREVVAGYDRWTFAQFQYSFMDAGRDPGSVGLDYAAGRGLAVVVTGPLKSGRLVQTPPEAVRDIWTATPHDWTPAEWALRSVWDLPAVSTVVCGIATRGQLHEDLAVADRAEADALGVRDELAINRVRDAYWARREIDCASCRPCLPCPEGIDIPRVFEIYNEAVVYDDVKTAARVYRDEGHRADLCTACGLCESRCARSPALPIVDLLREAHELLGG